MIFHFSELFFPILKEEIEEKLKNKRVKKNILKDYEIFIIFEKKLSLLISLHPQIYYILFDYVSEISGKEIPYLKEFVLKNSEIIEGERFMTLNFERKNPLGEIEKRKAIIDFTKRAKDFLILKEDKVIYSFRKKKEFKVNLFSKINIFKGKMNDEKFFYIKKHMPYLCEILNEKDKDLKNKLELIKKGSFYVDEDLNLHFIKDDKYIEFPSLNEVLLFIYRKIKEKMEEEKKQRILKKKKEKEERKRLIREIKIDPEVYRIKGDVILMNLKQLKGKKGKFKLFHPEKGEVEVEIRKNETPEKAAERYYERYKKMKRKIEKTKEIKEKKEEKKPFREYISPSGFKVYVSKSQDVANSLTFKKADPWDYFFHVRDAPGAHVIIKRSKNEEIRKEDIIFAAKLAKKFSKLKNEEKVLVIWTERKYVKPIKGFKGKVKILKENVIRI